MNQALALAMETGTAFSWTKTRKVQAGVYLTWSQNYFWSYLLK